MRRTSSLRAPVGTPPSENSPVALVVMPIEVSAIVTCAVAIAVLLPSVTRPRTLPVLPASRCRAEAESRWQLGANVTEADIDIVDGHVGLGYAKSRTEELATIRDLARSDGVVLDPVYTGKAFHGVVTELRRDPDRFGSTIAFVHTGGMFGLFGPNPIDEVL